MNQQRQIVAEVVFCIINIFRLAEVSHLVYDTEVTANTMQHCMSYDRMIMNNVQGGISGKIFTETYEQIWDHFKS
jgi:hypothetical protein